MPDETPKPIPEVEINLPPGADATIRFYNPVPIVEVEAPGTRTAFTVVSGKVLFTLLPDGPFNVYSAPDHLAPRSRVVDKRELTVLEVVGDWWCVFKGANRSLWIRAPKIGG